MSWLPVPFRMQDRGWVVFLYCASIGIALDGWKLGPLVGVLLLASLLIHEVGHMAMAAKLGVPVREFGLCLTGAYIRRAYATRRRDEILIAFAGPLTNLVIALPLFFMHIVGVQLALANICLGVINLLPIPASDGMRILKTIRNQGAPGPAVPVPAELALTSATRTKAVAKPQIQFEPQVRPQA